LQRNIGGIGMIRIKTIIKNIGPHKDLEITYQHGITPIVGKNGAGKTFLLESLPACLFGVFPSRGNITNCITQGFIGDAYLSEEFELDGHNYIIERKIRKTAKTIQQDAMIFCNGEAVAGPKIKDVEDAVNTIIGDKDIFFASVFSSQLGVYEIIDELPSKRKEIFNKILNLDAFNGKRDQFKDSCCILNEELRNITYQISTKREYIDLKVNEKDILFLESQLKLSEQEKNKYQGKISELKETQKSWLDKKSKETDIKLHFAIKNRELTELSTSLETLISKELLINGLVQSKPEIIENQKQYAKILEANRETNIENEKKRIVIAKNDIITAKIDRFNNEIEIKNTTICGIKRNIKELEKETEILIKIDVENEQCKKCALLQNAFENQLKIKSLNEQVAVLTKEIESIFADIAAIITTLKKEESLADLVVPPIDRQEELAAINLSEVELAGIKEKIKTLSSNKEILEKECEDTKSQMDLDIDKELAIVSNLLEVEEANLTNINIKSQEEAIFLAKNAMAKNKKIAEELLVYKTKEKQVLRKLEIHRYLLKAFGKDGIPVLIVDQAIPKIQSISDDLLQIASNGKFSLEFDTIKENKDGSLRESLEIRCRSEEGVRDVSTFSGGEQKILKTVLRLSLAIFQSQNSGIKFKTLMLDELFDALDDDNSYNLLSMLNKTKDYFYRIIFVSHDDELIGDYLNKIVL
jgi:DNA repair protein SbcC/Rad50